MNDIHSSAVLEGQIAMGTGNVICPGVAILGPATIGSNNYFGPGVSVGAISRERLDPSHRLADPLSPDRSAVVIGDHNTIFDHAVIHKPMFHETRIENRVAVGAMALVAHDCLVRDAAILAPRVSLGAYVTVGRGANLGLGASVHNRLTIGAFAMCGLGSAVVGHVPVAALIFGNPARIRGVNKVGLTRAEFSDEIVDSALENLHGHDSEMTGPLGVLIEQYRADRGRWPSSKGEVRWKVPR